MDLNGFVQEHDEEYDNDFVPKQFDSLIVGYTNSRSYFKLKLQHIKTTFKRARK